MHQTLNVNFIRTLFAETIKKNFTIEIQMYLCFKHILLNEVEAIFICVSTIKGDMLENKMVLQGVDIEAE